MRALQQMTSTKAGQGIGSQLPEAFWTGTVVRMSCSASKGGVLSVSRDHSAEFARQGIRLNALCPGPVKHSFAEGAFLQESGIVGA